MREANAVNDKVKSFLLELSDEGTFFIKNTRGSHKKIVASYGGIKRIFTLANTPRQLFYPKYMVSAVNRFVQSLNLKNKPKFTF